MKKCQACGALSFDDSEICYGCMKRFSEGTLVFADHASKRMMVELVSNLEAEVIPLLSERQSEQVPKCFDALKSQVADASVFA